MSDTIDLGDATSRTQQAYTGPPADQPLTATYEGDHDDQPVTDTVSSSTALTLSPSQVAALTSKAASLHETDIAFYHASSSAAHASETSFLTKLSASGTLSDRLSALTLLAQSSLLHNTRVPSVLLTMAELGKGKCGREENTALRRGLVG